MHFIEKEPSQKRKDFSDKLKSNKIYELINVEFENDYMINTH